MRLIHRAGLATPAMCRQYPRDSVLTIIKGKRLVRHWEIGHERLKNNFARENAHMNNSVLTLNQRLLQIESSGGFKEGAGWAMALPNFCLAPVCPPSLFLNFPFMLV